MFLEEFIIKMVTIYNAPSHKGCERAELSEEEN